MDSRGVAENAEFLRKIDMGLIHRFAPALDEVRMRMRMRMGLLFSKDLSLIPGVLRAFSCSVVAGHLN